MGYYTTFKFDCTLRSDVPQDVYEFLMKWITGELWARAALVKRPRRRIFDCERWAGAIGCEMEVPSFPLEKASLVGDKLRCRSCFQNYDDEVSLFLDWIRSYMVDGSGAGLVQAEDEEKPREVRL